MDVTLHKVVDQHDLRISDKSCVISALDDDLQTIQSYVHQAALRQGLSAQTQVTEIVRTGSSHLGALAERYLPLFFSPLSCIKYLLQRINSL